MARKLTEAETLALGDYSASLMRDDRFNDLCGLFRENAFDALMGTEPHETKKREGIYAETWGLHNFLSLMKSYVDQSETIRSASQDDQQAPENEQADCP